MFGRTHLATQWNQNQNLALRLSRTGLDRYVSLRKCGSLLNAVCLVNRVLVPVRLCLSPTIGGCWSGWSVCAAAPVFARYLPGSEVT